MTKAKFTVTDLPMIQKAVKPARWQGMNDHVKRDIVNLIHATINSEHASESAKLKAATIGLRIDKINQEEEHFYTPKGQLEVSSLSDEELDAQIEQLNALTTQAKEGTNVLNAAALPIHQIPEDLLHALYGHDPDLYLGLRGNTPAFESPEQVDSNNYKQSHEYGDKPGSPDAHPGRFRPGYYNATIIDKTQLKDHRMLKAHRAEKAQKKYRVY